MREDLRLALLSLARAPWQSLLTLLTLACGLGFAVYCYCMYLGFIEGSLPFQAPDRIVGIEATRDGDRMQARSVLYADLLEFRDSLPSVEDLAPLTTLPATVGSPRRTPVVVSAAQIAAPFWRWAAVRPLQGRLLQAADEGPDAPPVVLIGERLWREQLMGSTQVLGQVLRVNGVERTVVGVLPDAVRLPLNQQLWLPFQAPRAEQMQRQERMSIGTPGHVMLLARLKPQAGLASLQAELDLAGRQLAQRYPRSHAQLGLVAVGYTNWGMSDAGTITLTLAVAAALLLCLVSLNAGNLLLGRANERRQDIALRLALGAPRARLVMQSLMESLVLSLLGTGVGAFFAAWALTLTQQAAEASSDGRMPFWIHFELRPKALLFALLLALLTALLTGGLPAWRGSDVDTADVLKDGQRGSPGVRAGRFSRLLVVVQMSLAALLLWVSGTQLYAAQQRLGQGTGARMDDVLTARVHWQAPTPAPAPASAASAASPADDIATRRSQDTRALWARLEAQLDSHAQTAGIHGAALATFLPGGSASAVELLAIEGQPAVPERAPVSHSYGVSTGFFQTLDIRLLEGRGFGSQDREGGQLVAVVNKTFAQQHWPGESALGHRFAWLDPDRPQALQWITVVGVCEPVAHGLVRLASQRQPVAYQPLAQLAALPQQMELAWVGGRDTASQREWMGRAVSEADPDLALQGVRSAWERQQMALAGADVMAGVCTALGLMSLLLAVSGIYGVTHRAVALRRHELAVRAAVGAPPAALLTLLMRRSLWQLALALLLGLPAGWVALGAMDLQSVDFLWGAAASALLIAGVALLATWLPARQALRQPPSRLLQAL